MPRSQLEVEVIGLDAVKAMNSALTSHDRAVSKLASTYQQFNSAVGASAGAVRQAAGAQQSLGSSLQSNNANLATARQGHENLLTTLLRYRLVSEVFHGVQESIQAAGKAFLDYNYQAGRTVRINGGSGRQVEAELRVGTAMTGLDPKVAGETYYQLGTFIKDTTQLSRTFREEMKLVNGTEGDARDTARTSVQIYEDFGDQLGKNTTVSERFRRANELLAITFKDSHAEIGEISNALKYLAPIAETAGVKVEQLFAVMTALTAKGMRGRMEGTEAGAFISRLIKAYNDGVGGIESKGKVYHFDFAKDAQGGLDLIRTLDDIHRRHQELQRTNQSAAREYLTAIGGQQNAIRFLGTMSDSTLNRMESEWQKNKAATAGLTHEVDGLNNAMNATADKKAAMAWQSFLGVLSLGLADVYDKLSKIQLLHDFVKGLKADLQMNASNEERGQQLLHQTPVEHAVDMRNLLRVSLQEEKAHRNDVSAGHDTFIGGLINHPNLNPDHLPIEYLRKSNLLKPTELNAVLQLLPKRFDALSFLAQSSTGLENKERVRYTTREDILAAIAKIEGDIPKFQEQHLHELHASTAGSGTNRWAGVIDAASKHTGVSSTLLRAVMQAESSGDQSSVSRTGAIGLMQLMPGTARGLGVNPHDPAQNVMGGARYLQQLLSEFHGNTDLALAAYNAGDGAVKKYHGIPPYAETQAYVKHVEALAQKYGGVGHYSGASITDAPTDPSKAADERERAIEEARRKQLDILHDRQRIAQDDFKEAQKRLTDFAKDQDRPLDPKTFDAKLKPLQQAYDAAKTSLVKITGQVAQAENDPATLRLIKKGTLIDGVDTDEQKRSNLEKYLKFQADRKADYADLAVQKYGLFDPTTAQRAMEAQEAAIKSAQQQGDLEEVSRLTTHRSGPLRTFLDQYSQGTQSETASGKGILDFWNKTSLAGGENILNETERRLHDIDLGQRPENLFSNQKEGALDTLTAKQSVLQEGLTALGPATNENRDQFEKLSDELRQVNQEIGNFKDKIAGEKFHQALQDLGDKTKHSLDILEMKSGLKQYLNPDSAKDQQRQLLQQTIGYYAQNLSDVQSLASTATGDAQREAKKAVEQAQLQLQQSKYNLQRFDSEQQFRQREHFAGMASSAAVELYHGEKPDKVFSKLGDQVVTNAIQKLIGSAFDPHTVAVRQNTVAVQMLTGAIAGTGGAPSAGPGSLTDAVQKSVDAHTGAGGAGGTGVPSKITSNNKTGTYVNDALAGYGVFSQGMQQGSSLGSVLGAAGAGFAMGGPIGAAIGGGLNLLGGLFHHSNPQDKNPALYHAPSDFEYDAYKYRLDRSPGTPIKGSNAQAPIMVTVEVHQDGIKTAVQRVVAQQSQTSRTATAAAVFDHYQPH